MRWTGLKEKYPRDGWAVEDAASVGANLRSALLKEPLPGKKKAHPEGRAWQKFVFSAAFQSPQQHRSAPAMDADPQFFERVAGCFQTEQSTLISAIVRLATFTEDPFVFWESKGSEGKAEIDWTRGLPEVLLFGRLVQATGRDDAANDLALQAYLYLRALVISYRSEASVFADIYGRARSTVDALPFALAGFTSLQSWAAEDLGLLVEPSAPPLQLPSYAGSWGVVR